MFEEIAEGIVVSTAFRRITVGAVATGQGVVCIDAPPFPREARQWHSLLLEHFKQPIRLLILTDAHRDRLPGLYWFDDVRIVAHDATAAQIKTLSQNFIDQTADLLSADSDERATFSGVHLRCPTVTFNDRMTVYVGDVPLTITAMPGPTPGNVWLHLPDQRVLFAGDSVVVDTPPYMAQVRSKAWLDSLTFLRRPRFAADQIVPGRGPVTDKESTLLLSEFLRFARRRVQHIYRAGRSRADLAEILPEVLAQLDLAPGKNEEAERRIRLGLDSIYDEFLREDHPPAPPPPPPPPDDDDL